MNLNQQWREDASRIPGAGLEAYGNSSISAELDRVYALMVLYYGEPWRRYHTLTHIVSFREALNEMELCPLSVKIAGYFHDVIWVPGYAQAEERSAEIADRWLEAVGAEEPFRLPERLCAF